MELKRKIPKVAEALEFRVSDLIDDVQALIELIDPEIDDDAPLLYELEKLENLFLDAYDLTV